jgi:hypothetical protein
MSLGAVRTFCLRCGPNASVCERLRRSACPAVKLHPATKASYDELVRAWEKKHARKTPDSWVFEDEWLD